MNSEQLLAQMQLIREQMAQLESKWFELNDKYKQERRKEKVIDGTHQSATLKFR